MLRLWHKKTDSQCAHRNTQWPHTHTVCLECVQVLMTTDGLYDHVLKIKPPLVFSVDDGQRMCACLRAALEAMPAADSEVAALQARILAKHAPGQELSQEYFTCGRSPGKT